MRPLSGPLLEAATDGAGYSPASCTDLPLLGYSTVSYTCSNIAYVARSNKLTRKTFHRGIEFDHCNPNSWPVDDASTYCTCRRREVKLFEVSADWLYRRSSHGYEDTPTDIENTDCSTRIPMSLWTLKPAAGALHTYVFSPSLSLSTSSSSVVRAGSASRGANVALNVLNIKQTSSPTPFYSVLVFASVFIALSTVFHGCNGQCYERRAST